MLAFGKRLLCVKRPIGSIITEIDRDISASVAIRSIMGKLAASSVDFDDTNSFSLIDYSFACGRLFKLSHSRSDKQKLTNMVEDASFRLDLSADISSTDAARFLWACATVGVDPLLPDGFVDRLMQRGVASNKDMCTIVWALSKWARSNESNKKPMFKKLLDSISDDVTRELSNDDITALIRAIAVVYGK